MSGKMPDTTGWLYLRYACGQDARGYRIVRG
jgi:hypothetical protein